LALSGLDARSFLKAADFVRHALPSRLQKEPGQELYAYHIDKSDTGGYVTATDGHRSSRWVFHTHTDSPAFCGQVYVDDVEAYRRARRDAVFLTPAEGISYPDVWQATWDAMRGFVRLGRVTRVKALLHVVSAFERAGLDLVMVWVRESDVHITGEDEGLKLQAHVAGVIEDGGIEVSFCITPAYLAGALRSIERGKPRESKVVADLSPQALRLTVMDGVVVVAEEVIMT
jgi:hypothetical protein